MQRSEVLAVLGYLCSMYEPSMWRPISEETREGYVAELLQIGLDGPTLMQAAREHVRECSRWPKVAELRERHDAIAEKRTRRPTQAPQLTGARATRDDIRALQRRFGAVPVGDAVKDAMKGVKG